MFDEMLAYNKKFVEEKKYVDYAADKFPSKKVAILACMDTRLVKLLPAALGIKDGDVKMIKNAGAFITDPYDSTVRSMLVAIGELGVKELVVLGHTTCGVEKMEGAELIEILEKDHGIDVAAAKAHAEAHGIDAAKWMNGFNTVEEAVKDTCKLLQDHPFIPKDVTVRGGVMDTITGGVTMLV